MYEATTDSVKCAWIEAQRKNFGLDEMCRMLDVSENGHRAWKQGSKPYHKRLTDAWMLTLIQSIDRGKVKIAPWLKD